MFSTGAARRAEMEERQTEQEFLANLREPTLREQSPEQEFLANLGEPTLQEQSPEQEFLANLSEPTLREQSPELFSELSEHAEEEPPREDSDGSESTEYVYLKDQVTQTIIQGNIQVIVKFDSENCSPHSLMQTEGTRLEIVRADDYAWSRQTQTYVTGDFDLILNSSENINID